MHFHREFKGVSTNTAIFIGEYNPVELILLVFLPCHSTYCIFMQLVSHENNSQQIPFSCKEYMTWRKCRKRKALGPGKFLVDLFEILLLSNLQHNRVCIKKKTKNTKQS